MKINTKLVLSACIYVSAAAHADQKLHPADIYDIKFQAQSAVSNMLLTTGSPKKVPTGYEVVVTVEGLQCKVLVQPYSNTSPFAPPARWTVDGDPECRPSTTKKIKE